MKKEDILISKAANLSVADLFEIQAKNNPKLLAVQDVDGKKYQYRQTLNRVLKISKIFINKFTYSLILNSLPVPILIRFSFIFLFIKYTQASAISST